MTFQEYASRVEYLKHLIEKGQVNSPIQIAKKWDCSEKTVRRMINCLRSEGLDIIYDKTLRRYIIKY